MSNSITYSDNKVIFFKKKIEALPTTYKEGVDFGYYEGNTNQYIWLSSNVYKETGSRGTFAKNEYRVTYAFLPLTVDGEYDYDIAETGIATDEGCIEPKLIYIFDDKATNLSRFKTKELPYPNKIDGRAVYKFRSEALQEAQKWVDVFVAENNIKLAVDSVEDEESLALTKLDEIRERNAKAKAKFATNKPKPQSK